MGVLVDTKNGSTSRSTAQHTSSLFFMTLPSDQIWMLEWDASSAQTSHKQAIYALLSRARYTREEIESLYRSLAGIAAQAHALRDIEAVELASQIMLALPVSSRAKNVARYYQAFYVKRKGDFEAARQRLDLLLDEELDPRLRARALITKGATYFDAGQIDQALPFYIEAGQLGRNCELAALVGSLHQTAIIKGMDGDHHAAVADLEALVPVARQIASRDPEEYAALMNSYAVELGEIGQVEQALNVVSRVACFSSLVPQISETIPELKSKLPTRKHSVVVIHRPEPVAALQANPNRGRKRVRTSTLVMREAERRFTSLRALPASRVLPATILAAINPARQPAKPRAP